MAKRTSNSKPTWVDVKAKLAGFDRAGLLALIQDLYGAQKDVQTFLHTRLGVGEDPLKPYKETIDRWLWPDLFRKQNVSVAKANQAVSDYKKAVNDPAGLAELLVYYCERAVGFSHEVGYDDESYYNSLERTFAQALVAAYALPDAIRGPLIARLDRVCAVSRDFGYGVGDAMQDIFVDFEDRCG
jgi:hypothetical protein